MFKTFYRRFLLIGEALWWMLLVPIIIIIALFAAAFGGGLAAGLIMLFILPAIFWGALAFNEIFMKW